MNDYTFVQIRNRVLKWYQMCIGKDMYNMMISSNDDKALVIDLSFPYCLAQIVICEPFMAPYKNVSFEAATVESQMAIESGTPELIYFFYDSKETSEQDVIDELDIGVSYCLQYVPNQLELKYKNRLGIVDINSEEIDRYIHLDDLEKYNNEIVNMESVCVDVQSQYLVIQNSKYKLRILPNCFRLL